MEKIENRIIDVLRFRAPNAVVDLIIYDELKDIDNDKIDKALKNLLEKEMIQELNAKSKSFKLSNYDYINIRETIYLGDKKIPRLRTGDNSRVEDINYAMESLAQYADTLENKFERKLNKQIQSYWINIISIFGVFIALFSFIIKISNQEIKTGNGFWCTIADGFANLLPLIVLLTVLLLLIKILFINKNK